METEVVDLRQITKCIVEFQKPKAEKILNALEKIYDYSPLGTEVASAKNAITRLVDEWFRLKISEHYDELDSDIAKYARHVIIDIAKQEVSQKYNYSDRKPFGMVEADIPLFCLAELGEEKWQYKCETSNYYFTITSNMPFIPKKAVVAATAAKQSCYEIYAKALKTKPLGEILTLKPTIFPEPSLTKLNVAWYARPSELKISAIQNKDPAIILQWKRPYLVHRWEENILPIENILLDALKV